MRRTTLLAATALLLAGCSSTPPPNPATAIISVPAGPNDEYVELREFSRQKPATRGSDGEPVYTLDWIQSHRRELHRRGLAFLEKYPTHPRRWDVVLLMKGGPDWKEVQEGWGPSTYIPDPERSRDWVKRYRALLEQLVLAPDASSAARRTALWELIVDGGRQYAREAAGRDPVMLEKLRRWIMAFEQEYKDTGGESAVYGSYAAALASENPDEAVAFLERTKAIYDGDTPMHRRTRQFLDGYVRYVRGTKAPAISHLWQQLKVLEPAFNSEPYRGNVVVLCVGPVESPGVRFHLQQVWDVYHAKGVKIIQVDSFNRAVGKPSVDSQRAKVQALVREHHISWPVLWNTNDHYAFASEWGRSGIPTGLVFDRSGKIAAEGFTQIVIEKVLDCETTADSTPQPIP